MWSCSVSLGHSKEQIEVRTTTQKVVLDLRSSFFSLLIEQCRNKSTLHYFRWSWLVSKTSKTTKSVQIVSADRKHHTDRITLYAVYFCVLLFKGLDMTWMKPYRNKIYCFEACSEINEPFFKTFGKFLEVWQTDKDLWWVCLLTTIFWLKGIRKLDNKGYFFKNYFNWIFISVLFSFIIDFFCNFRRRKKLITNIWRDRFFTENKPWLLEDNEKLVFCLFPFLLTAPGRENKGFILFYLVSWPCFYFLPGLH